MNTRQSLTATQKQNLSDFIFGKSEVNPMDEIRKCNLEAKRHLNKYHKLDTLELFTDVSKLCTCCGEIKEYSLFYKSSIFNDGYQAHCKQCQKMRLDEKQYNSRRKNSK